MNDTLIVTIFTVIDDVMTTLDHRTHLRPHTSDSEVLTVATVAACQFQNHHQRALCVLHGIHSLSGSLSPFPLQSAVARPHPRRLCHQAARLLACPRGR